MSKNRNQFASSRIRDGVYLISPKQQLTKYLGRFVTDNFKSNEVIKEFHSGHKKEMWRFLWSENHKAYQIMCLENEYVLTWDSNFSNTKVLLQSPNTSKKNQFWKLIEINGYYQLVNAQDETKTLYIMTDNPNFDSIHLQPYSFRNDAQAFKIFRKDFGPVSEESVLISPIKDLGLNFHVDAGNNVVLWHKINTPKERWVLQYVPARSAHIITNAKNTYMLSWNSDRSENTFASLDPIIPEALWLVDIVENNNLIFRNFRYPAKRLSIKNGAATPSSNIIVKEFDDNSTSQDCRFVRKDGEILRNTYFQKIYLEVDVSVGEDLKYVNQRLKRGFNEFYVAKKENDIADRFIRNGYIDTADHTSFTVKYGFFNLHGKIYYSDPETMNSAVGETLINGYKFFFNDDKKDPYLINYQIINYSDVNIIDGEYKIASKLNNSKIVNVHIAGNDPNNVIIWDNANQPQQKWKFKYDNNFRAYKIHSVMDENKVLARVNGTGTNVFIYDNIPNAQDQYWILEDVGEGYYIFKNYQNQNMVLDLYNSDTANGSNIQVFQKNDGNNQKFKLIE